MTSRKRLYTDAQLTEAATLAFTTSFRHASETLGPSPYTIYAYAVDHRLPIKNRWARSRRYSVELVKQASALLAQGIPSRAVAERTGITYSYIRLLKRDCKPSV